MSESEFFSFDVPVHAIPESIRKHPSLSSLSLPAEQRTRLVYASKEPIIPKKSCEYLIQLPKTQPIGLDGPRIVMYKLLHMMFQSLIYPRHKTMGAPSLSRKPLSSFVSTSCPRIRNQFNKFTSTRLLHSSVQSNDQSSLSNDCTNDNDGSLPGFSFFKPNQDESLLSLTIALNDMDVDYQEGGLYLDSTGDVLNGPAGTVMCFAGGLVHGGYPVSKGTRWILTAFLYVDSNQSGMNPGYTLDTLEQFMAKQTKNQHAEK